jgi:hypothetical protein
MAKIGLWDEISLIAGWEEQKQLIVKNCELKSV